MSFTPTMIFSREQIDQAAKEKGISRVQLVSTAIESVLHRGGEDIENIRRELDQARRPIRAKADDLEMGLKKVLQVDYDR